MKKGTSAPMCFDIFINWSLVNPISYKLLMPIMVDAALLDPPPKPAPMGIFLSTCMFTPLRAENSFFILLYALKQVFDESIGKSILFDDSWQPSLALVNVIMSWNRNS